MGGCRGWEHRACEVTPLQVECAHGGYCGQGMSWAGDVVGTGTLLLSWVGGHHGQGDMLRETAWAGACCGQGMLWAREWHGYRDTVGRGCWGQGMPSQGTSWQGLSRAGTSGFPPSSDLTNGARGHNVALRRQADQGHALVQSGRPAMRAAVGHCASAAGSRAWWGWGSPAHLTSFSITSWDSEGPQTIRAMGIVC